jgi:hypothetical protein
MLDSDSYSWGVTAEQFMLPLRAKKSMITAAFQQLGREGILGHKKRMRLDYREDLWYPSRYTLIKRSKNG